MTARVDPLGARARSDAAGGVLAGILLSVAFLPLPRPAALLVLVALVPLWRVLFRIGEPRRGAEIGAVFGVTFWALQLAWVPLVAIRTGESWPWMAWAGQVALLGLLGAAMGGGFVLVRRRRVPAPAAAMIAWVGVEWARGHLLGPLSFPWSGVAVPLARIPVLVQPAAWGGEALLAGGVIAVNAAFAQAAVRERRRGEETGWRRAGLFSLALISLWVGFGLARLRLLDDYQPRARAVVVQPAVPLAGKRGPLAQELALRSLHWGLAEATALMEEGPSLVVFPETHLPFAFQGDGRAAGAGPDQEERFVEEGGRGVAPWPWELTAEIQGWASLHDASVLVGAYRRDDRGLYNALLHLGPEGVVGFYDKVALVPGVERGPGGLVPGGRPGLLTAQGRPGVLICIESAWATLGRGLARGGAGWLLNVTNDAWLGEEVDGVGVTSPAFYQHPWHLILRSVETGRGAVRVANNGLTGTVDPVGRWNRVLAPHQAGAAVVLVGGLDSDPVFLRGGHRLGLLVFLLLVLGPIVRRPYPS